MEPLTLESHYKNVHRKVTLSIPHVEGFFTTHVTPESSLVTPLIANSLPRFKYPQLHKPLMKTTPELLEEAPSFFDCSSTLLAQHTMFGVETSSIDIFTRRGLLRKVLIKLDPLSFYNVI